MAIGAVLLSLPAAICGSVCVWALNGPVLWQGLATYALVGYMALMDFFVSAAIASSRETGTIARSHGA